MVVTEEVTLFIGEVNRLPPLARAGVGMALKITSWPGRAVKARFEGVAVAELAMEETTGGFVCQAQTGTFGIAAAGADPTMVVDGADVVLTVGATVAESGGAWDTCRGVSVAGGSSECEQIACSGVR
mmetsp:Transcript_99862/g.298279  ORF Transcript_99862/g.298279 Transcript_99862/m.298279 type:complete len:127 (-) Transcript_99862:1312-1692(-)